MRTPIPVDTGRQRTLAMPRSDQPMLWALALAAAILLAIAV